MALHVSPFLCLGRWASHSGCMATPSWDMLVGSVLEWRVATTLNHSS